MSLLAYWLRSSRNNFDYLKWLYLFLIPIVVAVPSISFVYIGSLHTRVNFAT